jgi:formylglycine-generating enzyme
MRFFYMRRTTTSICFSIFILASFAQSPLIPAKPVMKKWFSHLSYIPAKTFTSLSHNGSDSLSGYLSRNSSVPGFFIGEHEVTNREYREFVHFVRDSLAHELLGHVTPAGTIDWGRTIDWKSVQLDPIMLSPEERPFGRKELDADKILYAIDFGGKTEIISVYPDTLVWISDFSYSYNEPLVKRYFSSAEYNNYPVVGISLKQALAFCKWKTMQYSRILNPGYEVKVELPTNSEWESAALEEKDSVSFSATGKGYNCNFGPIVDMNGLTIKSYKEDGFFYTGPVKSFAAGANGLYDMKGNVAEWTSTSRDEILASETKEEKRSLYFIAKGGGWNSSPYYTQAGACQFFTADESHSFIGFRYLVHITKSR